MAKLGKTNCLECGKEFQMKNSTHKFCSTECKKKHYGIKTVEKVAICQQCGQEYERKPNDTTSKYCSQVCKDRSRGRSGNRLNKEAICDYCGNTFEQKSAQQRFCSTRCSRKQRVLDNKQKLIGNKDFEKVCELCGDIFYSRKENARYCNRPIEVECPICKTKFQSKCSPNYPKTCGSKQCAIKYASIRTQETLLDKYGVNAPAKIPEVTDKIKQTNLERYGVTCTVHNDEIKEKVKQTNLERYGTEYYFASEDSKKKVRDYNMNKYGVHTNLLAPDVQEQIKQTNLRKYGAENPFGSKEVQEKIKQTVYQRYGVEYISQAKEVKEKMKQTNLERYGVEYISQAEEIKEKIRNTNQKKYGRYVFNANQKNVTNIKDYQNLTEFLTKNDKKFDCLQLSKYFNVHIGTIRKRIKEKNLQDYVNGFIKYSRPELQFKQFLDDIGLIEHIDYIPHCRSVIHPKELDFYFPKFKLAVEISPSYTHSHQALTERLESEAKARTYHYDKFAQCKQMGIELITIFEWHDIDKICNFIYSKMNVANRQKVYARKCNVNIVHKVTREHKEFLENNHILGKVNNNKNSVVYELVYENKVVAIACFENKGDYTELRRLAFVDNMQVIGGASKLIAHWKQNNANIPLITFSDNDLGSGNVYEQLGFRKVSVNKGTLHWWHEEYEFHISNLSLVRQGADRLLKNFPDYEPVGMGEDLPSNQEIVMSYGFNPYFDVGYTKWLL